MKTYRTFSSLQTKEAGAQVAAKILAETAKKKSPADTATIMALYGDLGAGKTTFTQGFLKALGARGRITSPTFVLMKRFSLSPPAKPDGKRRDFTHAYHIDAYRFRAPHESDALGLKEILKDPQAVVVIEWPERLKGLLPRAKTAIRFTHGKREQERVIMAS